MTILSLMLALKDEGVGTKVFGIGIEIFQALVLRNGIA